jgi:hypothetical protein
MKVGFKLKALVAGAMLCAGGSAFADMNIDTTNGDIFLNLWDQTNATSFIYDTGLNQTTFDGTNTVFSVNLASDANYTAFLAGVGGSDVVTYNVVSAGFNGAYTTGAAAPSASVFNTKLNTANAAGGSIAQQASAPNLASSTTNSAYATPSTNPNAVWGVADNTWNLNLKLAADGSVGTALNFYSLIFGAGTHTSSTVKSVVTTFANTWLLDSAGNLTYNAVPVPAPFGLLLGGLALMGAISRRKQSAAEKEVEGAAA